MLKKGERIPAFTLPRLDAPTQAETAWVRSEDLLARGPVFMVFLKSSCPTCMWSVPYLERFFQRFPNSSTSMFPILQETEERARELLSEFQTRIPVLVDDHPYEVSESFGLRYVPSGFYIGRFGLVENCFEAFDRRELTEIYSKIAQQDNFLVPPLFQENEGVPAFRPG